MKEYHKIQTVFLRDPENRMKTLMMGEWAKPEFKALKECEWIWTEKVDGTNIRIMWDGQNVSFGGKTDNAQIPAHLVNRLRELFPSEKLKSVFNETPACLYGEGYGRKIQKVGKEYLSDSNNFILFDCKIGKWWLERHNLLDISKKLDIDIVPVLARGPLVAAIEFAQNGYKSKISENGELLAEGLILKPSVELFNRKGERILTKIKYRDFKRN